MSMTILAIVVLELCLSAMSFYVIYKTSDMVANLIYIFTGISCLSVAFATMNGSIDAHHDALMMEHYLVSAAIIARFFSIVKVQESNRRHKPVCQKI